MRTPSFNYDVTRICRNCGNDFTGRYCNHCGEKVLIPADKSLGRMFSEVLNSITFLDNRVFRTAKMIFLRPGELSQKVMNGIRVPFLRPLSLFFIANLLYFLFPVFDTFNSHLRTQMHFMPYSTIASQMVEEKLEREGKTLQEFTTDYRNQSTNMSKLLLIVFVFLVAVPLALINYSNHYYFYDHVVVSLEYNSVIILAVQVILPRILMAISFVFFDSDTFLDTILHDSIFSWVAVTLSFFIFFRMERTVYNQKTKTALIKAFLMLPSLFIALQVYRISLFFVTMWTL